MKKKLAGCLLACLLLQACDRSGVDGGLKDRLRVAPDDAVCSLDAVNGQAVADSADVPAGSDVSFAGWVGDSTKQTPLAVTVVLVNGDGSAGIEGATGAARDDVAKALGAPALGNSGFTASAKLDIAPGTYSVSLLLRSDKGEERCSTHKTLNVR